jgi:hypothetical protein
MRVSLDRAEAAASGRVGLWTVRQTNASTEYALGASALLGTFPALHLAMVRTFMADKMSLTITPEQFAAAKAKLLPGLPASDTHLLSVVGSHVSEGDSKPRSTPCRPG